MGDCKLEKLEKEPVADSVKPQIWMKLYIDRSKILETKSALKRFSLNSYGKKIFSN